SNKPEMNHYFNDQAARFFAHYLQGARKQGPAPGGVTAFTTTCPLAAPENAPFQARGWGKLTRGSFGIGGGSGEFSSAGGNAALARAFGPTFGTSEACKAVPVTPEPNTVTLSRQVQRGFTMLGLPTVSARVSTTGQYGQIDARLWDVSPEGTQLLVTRGVYALRNGERGTVEFQLHGNGYHFAKGHTVRLQLLGRDAPYYQPGNFPFTVRVSDLALSLPTVQRQPR
ncbi:MAG: CocE/NonD family hydrolase C-terminal non-catalytic domain-containing protein, partial [Solirubrobacterales bacterium]